MSLDTDLVALFADTFLTVPVVFGAQSTRGFLDKRDVAPPSDPYSTTERRGREYSVLCRTGALTSVEVESSDFTVDGVVYRVIDAQLEDDGKTTRYFLQK